MKHLGRKLYHLLGGTGLLAAYHLLGRRPALLLSAILFVTVVLLEQLRLRVPAINAWCLARAGGLLRASEASRPTGTPAYVLGVGLAFLCFRPAIATAAVAFLACGDVAATAVGERFGRTRIARGKSLEGTGAFVAAALAGGLLVSLAGMPLTPVVVLAGALVAAATELLPLPVNDNLAIPLVSGGAMELIVRLL